MASQITSLTIVYSIVYSDADQRKHQSSASLAFVWGIHRGPVNSPHKWPVTRKMFPFDDVIMFVSNVAGSLVHDMKIRNWSINWGHGSIICTVYFTTSSWAYCLYKTLNEHGLCFATTSRCVHFLIQCYFIMFGDCDNERTMEPSLTMESSDPRPPISLDKANLRSLFSLDSTLIQLKTTLRFTRPSLIPGTIILVETAWPSAHPAKRKEKNKIE